MIWLITGGILVWMLIGMFATVMDWTLRFDLTGSDLHILIPGALMGPVALIFLFGSWMGDKTLIKYRGKS